MATVAIQPALAQQASAPQATIPQSDIVVTGERARLSNWRQAETQHVIVLSDGREGEVAQIARNLERLYFLLSVLLNRTERTDDTAKLRVTLIGDVAEFQKMDLRNLRWQQGPFNTAFDLQRYYDPREDGAVLATTRIDQRVVLQRGQSVVDALMGVQLSTPSTAGPNTVGSPGSSPMGQSGVFGLQSSADLIRPVGEESVPLSAESMIYAGFAQHYLTTFFPAAYPRWYLDGFGQLFSTLVVRGDTVMEYGRSPAGTTAVLHRFGNFRIADVLNGTYLTQPSSKTRWTPVHAWMLTHFLFFSPDRDGQLRRYLQAIARGTPPAEAASVFGDPDKLATDLRRYFHAKKPFERMTYPAERAEAPIVHRLSMGGAAFVKGRLELGSRVEAVTTGSALAQRETWLKRLRTDAAKYPTDEGAQVLLAEAECRSHHGAECSTAAARALALKPGSSAALTWSGVALAQQAMKQDSGARTAALRQARAMIARANRADTEAPAPLIAYYRSFADAQESAPVIAVDGLSKALTTVPNAPSTRLALGKELAARGAIAAARETLLPVAQGGYDSPERAEAEVVLTSLRGR